MGRGLQDVLLLPHGKMQTLLSEGNIVPCPSCVGVYFNRPFRKPDWPGGTLTSYLVN